MKLWMLRHGEAQPYQRNDAARQLTDFGREQVLLAATHAAGENFSHVICSPYIRARQTCELFLSNVGYEGEPEIVDWLTPDSSVREAIRQLNTYTEPSLLLIGHQPLLGNLAGWLIEGSSSSSLPFATASLACLSGDCLASAMSLQSFRHAVKD